MKGVSIRVTLFAAVVAVAMLTDSACSAAPDRDAYFNETHVHTSWSLDAFAIGNVLTNPGDAYENFRVVPE
ncbi:MAG: DUF3604 domain-containing protein [Deltaproteobacteria bacterium]|nr:DUF3604 domain-containing protein [Deltaproteobacteria bacterium]MBI3390188.1 DUF3604 domain-containing protein [Deltaproteobacteria bacterium]